MTADVMDQSAADKSPSAGPAAVADKSPAGPLPGADKATTGTATAADKATASSMTVTDKSVAAATALDASTGAGRPLAADEIRAMRERIDEIDQAIIDLWQERSRLSQEVGKTRMASGGTRLVLAREREIVDRFRAALGPDGTQVALLLLRSGRGPL